MELYQEERVVFYEDEHIYIMDNAKELKGVTTIMRENGLSPNYGDINPLVLKHAAEMGSNAHKAIEAYCNGEAVKTTKLIESFKKLNLDVVCCEYLVTDHDSIASSIDMIVKVDEQTVDLIDMKRTAEVHRDALAWQLGIYKVLFEIANPTIKVRNCYCLHIKKGLKDSIEKDTCQPLIEIQPMLESEVYNLIQAVQMGLPYEKPETLLPTLPFSNAELMDLNAAEDTIAKLESEMKLAKFIVDEYHERIYNYMLEKGLESISVGNGEYKLKKPYQVQQLDTKKLKEEMPEIAERYTQTAERKGNVTFKIK